MESNLNQPEAACPECDARVMFDSRHAEMVCGSGHVVEDRMPETTPLVKYTEDGRRVNPGNGGGLGSIFYMPRAKDMPESQSDRSRMKRLKIASIQYGQDRKGLPPEASAAVRAICARLGILQD